MDEPTQRRPATRDGAAATSSPAQRDDASARGRIEPPPREELERLIRRDATALAAFFDRYFDWIYGIACRLLGDRTAAEDISQDVFLKIHRGVHRLDPSRDPVPWLTTVVSNACREHWRGRHHRAASRSVSIDEIQDWEKRHPRAEGDPDANLLKEERGARVRAAVLALPEQLRDVVILYDFQGLSHKEIAGALHVSHDAVRKRYSRALAALTDRLGGIRDE